MMNVVLVGATLHQDNSSTNAANVTAQPRPGGGIRVSGGQFNIGTPNASAIHMNAQADLVGGGDDGLRGLDSVFAGWVNNETANENINGTFGRVNNAAAEPPNAFRVRFQPSFGLGNACCFGPPGVPAQPAVQ